MKILKSYLFFFHSAVLYKAFHTHEENSFILSEVMATSYDFCDVIQQVFSPKKVIEFLDYLDLLKQPKC